MIKKEFDSKPIYNAIYLKTKIRSYNEKMNTNFHNDKIPKEGSQCISQSVTLIDSVYRKDKDSYPKVFLEEYKYVVKEEKMSKFNTNNIEFSSGDADRENSDEENSNEKKIINVEIFFQKNKIFFFFQTLQFSS